MSQFLRAELRADSTKWMRSDYKLSKDYQQPENCNYQDAECKDALTSRKVQGRRLNWFCNTNGKVNGGIEGEIQ